MIPMYTYSAKPPLAAYLKHGLRELPQLLRTSLDQSPNNQAGPSCAQISLPLSPPATVAHLKRTSASTPPRARRQKSSSSSTAQDAPLACLQVRPTTYYNLGGKSPFSRPQARKEKEKSTRTGIEGSSGVRAVKVKPHVLGNGAHFLPFTDVDKLAEVVAREKLRCERGIIVGIRRRGG